MLNVCISARYFTKQFKCNTFPIGVIRTPFSCSLTGQAWIWSCEWLPSSPVTTPGWWEQAKHSWVLLGNKNSKLSRENGERETAEKDSMGSIFSQWNAQTSSSMHWHTDSHFCLLSTHLQIYCCPELVSVSHMKFPYVAHWLRNTGQIFDLAWGNVQFQMFFSHNHSRTYWRLQYVSIAPGLPTAFQTESIYFLRNVKDQTAFLDMQHEPSLQTNKYCDAIGSNLGGRGKATISGAHYRLPNNNEFRLEVIVLERETQMGHCIPAG